METKRFEFRGGDYWEIYAEQTWGAQRAVERLARTFLRMDGASVDAATGNITGDITLDPEKWDPDAANEVLLLHSTVAWSYGAVAPEVMARIPVADVQRVLDYMNEVYPQSDPLVARTTSASQPRSSSWPSPNPAVRSRRRWWTLTYFTRRDGRPRSSTPSP